MDRPEDFFTSRIKELKDWLKREDNLFDLFVVLSLLLFSFLVWYPTRYLPYFWDSAGFIIRAAQRLYETNFLPLIPNFSEFAHPPFLPAYIALVWKVFGIGRLATHLSYAPFLPAFLVGVYLFAKSVFKDRRLALLSAFLTAFFPVVLAETGIVYIELPTAAFVIWALYFFVKQKRIPFAILFSIALLTKFTAVLALPFFIYFLIKDEEYQEDFQGWLPFILTPLLLVLLWLVYHYMQTGWWLTVPSRPNLLFAPLSMKFKLIVLTLKRMFVTQGKWAATVLGVGSLIFLGERRALKDVLKNNIFMAVVITYAIALLLFALMGEFTLRYGIFLLPLFAIIVTFLTHKAISLVDENMAIKATAALLLAVAMLFAYLWHPSIEPATSYEFEQPNDLSYKDMINIGRQASTFLEIQHSQAKIYGAFPENYQLTEPIHGYVTKPLNFMPCSEFVKDDETLQIIYLHPYSPGQVRCQQLLQHEELVPYQRFDSNGKWVELYQVQASDSAELEDDVEPDGLPLN